MLKRLRTNLVFSCLLLPFAVAQANETGLGSISFPNSGAAQAQTAFLTGVKALHSFQFDEARFAFEEAQRIDPSFALAYWGQAMSDNHPLWAQQDVDAASAALNRLAPTPDGRLAKAPTEKEKAFLTAVETLYYSPGDKLARDQAYSKHMGGMHERWPDDHEIAIFYSLSLLGTVRPGDRGFQRQAQSAAIAQDVFKENPGHPGAAHFIIHAFDDPDHAILALPAAKVYADIAPAAAHALHMPSHIFLQLGMWQDVVSSNIDAYAAAIAVNEKYGLAEGREDFHTLSWLAYANLMLGQFDAAHENLSRAAATLDRNPDNTRVHNGYLDMRGRHILETGQWEELSLAPIDSVEGSHANWVAVVGMSAAHRGDTEAALAAEERLRMLMQTAEAGGNLYGARENAILEQEVAAIRLLKDGDPDGAVATARKAADMEMQYMRMPSGPPKPMKPAGELYGSILLAVDRPGEAMEAFEAALQWIPLRTPSMRGLANAAENSGNNKIAQEMYTQLKNMPGAHRRE
jgi:tetratricopeptide (TPR) repeat protein